MTRRGRLRDSLASWVGAGDLGQGLVEYGLILSLMAVVAVATLFFFGGEVSVILDAIGRALDTAG